MRNALRGFLLLEAAARDKNCHRIAVFEKKM
ncbi:hypothetical protein CK3_11770 [butyrate-producing bacterium SS3/4]|nr:hypothetical protein CK3_11770 [butyrate-producing bacterium SS3/4]